MLHLCCDRQLTCFIDFEEISILIQEEKKNKIFQRIFSAAEISKRKCLAKKANVFRACNRYSMIDILLLHVVFTVYK